MSRINSRNKGKRGESEVTERLKSLDIGEVEDHRQERTDHNLPDTGIPGAVCVEVKYREKFNAYASMEQVEQQASASKYSTSLRCVYHRRNRKDWLVVLRAGDFEKLLVSYLHANGGKWNV